MEMQISAPIKHEDRSPVFVRESRSVLLLWNAPVTLALVVFFAAWFTFLARPLGPNARAYVHYLGHYYPVSPEVARGAFLLLGGIFVLAFIATLIRRMLSASARSLSVVEGGVTATFGANSVFFPPAQLTGVRVSRLVIGARVRVNSHTPPFALSLADARRFVRALERLGVACRTNDEVLSRDFEPGLPADEFVRWQGRPGLRAFASSRWFHAIVSVPPPVIFALALWAIWTSGFSVVDRLLFTFLALMAVGFTAIGLIAMLASTFHEWSRELTGIMVITDKRIAWCARGPGTIYRELNGRDILSAALVEENGRRGWIGLSVRGEKGEVQEIDLFDLPRPVEALAALQALIEPDQSVTP